MAVRTTSSLAEEFHVTDTTTRNWMQQSETSFLTTTSFCPSPLASYSAINWFHSSGSGRRMPE
ncbi:MULTISPECIES: hypothetical protein [Myxococcus]|uniref:hypothetical protein n=1 Tax=Myxococcus TaxID=32 RepID=UPI0013CF7CFD|nr:MULTISPECIES: hypothetical protein [Myxococcus]NVJ23893.1 hypothetical protein [Myxococcus sp. AM011]